MNAMTTASPAPLLTIITVVRNAADALAATIDNVAAEKRVDVEYVVVDGASTDGTLDVIRARATVVDRFVSEPDRGIYDAMNKGVALARGRWLLFLNAGDCLRPGMAARMLAQAEQAQPPAAVVSGRVEMVDEQGRLLGYTHPLQRGDTQRLLRENCVAHQATLMRRSLFASHGGFSLDYKIMGDYEYWIRLRRAGAAILFTDDVVADFVTNGVSSQRSSYPRARREQLHVLVRHGYLSPTAAALQGLWSRILFHAKSVLRALLGARLSGAISLARARGQ